MKYREIRTAVRTLQHLDELTDEKGVPRLNTKTKFKIVDMLNVLEKIDKPIQKKLEILTKDHALKDDKGQVVGSPDGKGVQLHNPTLYEMALNDLMDTQVTERIRCPVLTQEDLVDVESHMHAVHYTGLGRFLKREVPQYEDVLEIGTD